MVYWRIIVTYAISSKKKRESMTSTTLTNLVKVYKQNPNNVLLKEIIKHADKLCYSFIQKRVPERLVNDCFDDIKSIALVESLNKFNINRKCQFSTYFIWNVRKHMWIKKASRNCQKNKGVKIFSLSEFTNLEDALTKSNRNLAHLFKKNIRKELKLLNLGITKKIFKIDVDKNILL